MKKLFTLSSIVLLIFVFNACGEDSTEKINKKVTAPAEPYLDSRVNAVNMAKESVKISNEAINKQNENIKKVIE
jgi:hypothetical protein